MRSKDWRDLMPRLSIFILVRLLALLWILALANIAQPLGAGIITLLIIASEALLGFVWGRTEARVKLCKPKNEDPRWLFVLMIGVGIVEAAAAAIWVGMYVPQLMAWRILSAYVPFAVVEFLTFRRLCR